MSIVLETNIIHYFRARIIEKGIENKKKSCRKKVFFSSRMDCAAVPIITLIRQLNNFKLLIVHLLFQKYQYLQRLSQHSKR